MGPWCAAAQGASRRGGRPAPNRVTQSPRVGYANPGLIYSTSLGLPNKRYTLSGQKNPNGVP